MRGKGFFLDQVLCASHCLHNGLGLHKIPLPYVWTYIWGVVCFLLVCANGDLHIEMQVVMVCSLFVWANDNIDNSFYFEAQTICIVVLVFFLPMITMCDKGIANRAY
jgi:hypothetical protein